MRLAVVVIGRNEAEHLPMSLASVRGGAGHVVYADSASTDGSAAIAERLGVDVVRLDDSPPMSAARGRNAGRARLSERSSDVEFIQFLDGDTELVDGWLTLASTYLEQHPDVGVVAGRLRERCRERNAFHRLADMEFDVPAGEVEAVGGIAMYRARAFDQAGGFDPNVVSGEERELHRRIAQLGYRVVRLNDTMALHDINMTHIGQWWRRAKRSGRTYAEHWIDRGILGRRVASICIWGGLFPASAVALALPTLGLSLVLLAPHALLYRRIRRDRILRGTPEDDATLYALATVAAKIPEMTGVAAVLKSRILETGQRS
ncbi:MAG: glycosyltransferase family 2 protein [Myxococcales bacterium]|nr:glycosyltransferase family 2 protein [Myxococcales bacterium]